jgi:putative heme transporter
VTEVEPSVADAGNEGMPPEKAAGSRWWNPRTKQVLRIAVSVVLVMAMFWYVLRQFADISEVWDAIRTLTWREMVVLALATVWNLATYGFVVMVATPGITFPQAMVMTQSTTAVANSVPAGGAVAVGLTYGILGSWGFSRSRTTLSVIVTGIWNNFIKLGTPILALVLLVTQGQPGGGRLVAGVLGLLGLVGAIAVFTLILASEDFARRVGLTTARWMSSLRRRLGRGPVHGWDLAVVKFRGRVIGLVRHRWVALTLTTLVSHASLFALLLLCLRVMGVSDAEVGWAEALAVFAFARLLTAIPLTPGGVGVIELALITGLTSAGGDDAQVVAAVLLFRLLSYVLPILLGAFAYLYWRRNRSWRDSAPPLPAFLSPIEAAT